MTDFTPYPVVSQPGRWRAWAKFGPYGNWRCVATHDRKVECDRLGRDAAAAEGRPAAFVVLPREQRPEDHDGPIERMPGRYGHDCVDA